ncbi:MAG: hypothetical protein WEB60_10345 [Terrimicrobiaceae bacterium]
MQKFILCLLAVAGPIILSSCESIDLDDDDDDRRVTRTTTQQTTTRSQPGNVVVETQSVQSY